MRLIALLFILIAPSWAAADKYVKDLTLSQVGPIFVRLIDGADGGCWTNLKEVKTYASNKIELAGGTLVDKIQEAREGIIFSIDINANRHPPYDFCHGSFSVRTAALGTAAHLPDSLSWIVYSELKFIALADQNFNTDILNTVKIALEEWKE